MSPAAGWQPVTLLYTADATGSVRIHLVRQDGGGTVYWDDVSVTEAPGNPGFEAGTLDSWAVYSPQTGFDARTAATHRSGTVGLAESGVFGITYQDVPGLTPNKTYAIRAYVSWSAGATAKAELSVHNTAGGNFSQKIMSPTAGWQPVTLLYTADATGSVRIHLVRQDGGGTVYWDDVSVTIDQPTSPVSLRTTP
jgi:hypothetical protein